MNKRSEKFVEIKDIRSKMLQVLENEEIKSVKGFGKVRTQVDMFVAKIDPRYDLESWQISNETFSSFAKKSKEDKNAQKKQQKEALLQNKIARDEARKAKFEAIKKEKMEKVVNRDLFENPDLLLGWVDRENRMESQREEIERSIRVWKATEKEEEIL